MGLIYKGVKAGAGQFNMSTIKEELDQMTAKGAQPFILGCTELPVAFQNHDFDFSFIDPGTILAKSAVIRAGYRLRKL